MHPQQLKLPLTILAWMLCLMTSVTLATPFSTSTVQGGLELGTGIQYLEDVGGKLTLDQVRQHRGWETNQNSTFSRGYSASTWWLKLTINNAEQRENWLLEIAYPVLDHIDFFALFEDGHQLSYTLGDKQPFWSRPLQHHNFLVPLQLPQNTSTDIYLRVQSKSSLQVPLILWDEQSFHTLQVGPTIMHGIYYGGLLIIALYNLLIYFVLGERAYLYYVTYIVSLALFVSGLHGWSFMFLWPNATQWNDQSILFFLGCSILFAVLFTRRFLASEKPFQTWVNLLFYLFIITCFAAIASAFLISYTVVISVLVPTAVASCLLGLTVGIVACFEKRASAPYYTLAWAMLFLGGIVIALNKANVLPSNIFTEYALLIGSLLEVLLLSFALAERINQERSLRIEAQAMALTTQKQANEALEERVTERTLELEQANKKLQQLSDTDQLTGLKNRRYLNQFLDDEFARSNRYKHSIAILMIDIDHFKSVNDNYGHLAGDLCLKAVAEQIRQCNREPTDLVARYGGEEFCFVLPETSNSGALVVAERILRQVENTVVSLKSGSLRVTCSIGIYAAVPASDKEVNAFIDRADAALYHAKQSGRNCLTDFTDIP